MTRSTFAASLVVALLATASFVAADGKEKGESKSARDESANPKIADKKGQDLGERVEALERQVRELVAMLKGKEAGGDKMMAAKKAAAEDAHAIAVLNKQKAINEEKAAQAEKAQPKKTFESAPPKKPVQLDAPKKPSPAGDDSPQVIKGKDGQPYVRLSDLPPEFQKKFGGQGGDAKGESEKQGKVKKQEKDDDDDKDDDDKGKKSNKSDKD